jgi:alpha-1,2-mannosyltransferase
MTISSGKVKFVYLHKRRYVEASMYPYFTMLGQSIGSVILGIEALLNTQPDIFIDTMGYAFTLPLFKYVCGSKIGCYVHYPTISTDMLDAVQSRRSAFNNKRRVSRSPLATFIKLRYYRLFAWLYGRCGSAADVVMVNSSWTEEHICSIWNNKSLVHKVFPPCEVTHLTKIPATRSTAETRKIISLGQFRPEKDHPMQIKAMYELRQIISDEEWEKVKLVIIGGCRGAEDEKLVKDLKDLCKYLSVEDNVEFCVNLGYPELLAALGDGLVGIHTMWNEHFGIGIVEMMAAGLLTVAHRSGGPLMDIMIEEAGARNGFLAATPQEYAAHLAYILSMTEEGREGIRERARSSVNMFSSQQFDSGWIRATDPLFPN